MIKRKWEGAILHHAMKQVNLLARGEVVSSGDADRGALVGGDHVALFGRVVADVGAYVLEQRIGNACVDSTPDVVPKTNTRGWKTSVESFTHEP